jgi:hypothetical protein
MAAKLIRKPRGLLGHNLVISIQKPQTQSIATGKVPKESGIKHLDLSSWK